jgi:hypothetical protein
MRITDRRLTVRWVDGEAGVSARRDVTAAMGIKSDVGR